MSTLTKTLLVGLTGGIACGKTTVANYLAEKGAYLIDTDMIAREVVVPDSPTTAKIRTLLGDTYFLADGHLNRAKIKQYIFNHPAIKQQYEAIILPAIRQATMQAIQHIPEHSCYAILIVPLLFEKGLDSYTDYNIVVDLPVEVQIQRAIARRPDDGEVIKQIIAAQMPRQARNARADYLVDNHVPIRQLIRQLDQLHSRLCDLSTERKKLNENKYVNKPLH